MPSVGSPTETKRLSGDAPLRRQVLRSLQQILRESLGRAHPRSPLSRLLHAALEGLHAGELEVALRSLDRAWRSLPEESGPLAPVYGRLLALEDRDHNASLGLLQRAITTAPDPDIAALTALTLLRLERFEEARRQLSGALAEYCVIPGALLYEIASRVAEHPGIDLPGWIGRGSRLEILGELSESESSTRLEITIAGETAFSQLLRPHKRPNRRHFFSFPSPTPRSFHEALGVTAHGVALLGSGARIPLDFGLDGRAATQRNQLTGWARLGWLPTRAPHLRIVDERGDRIVPRTDTLALPVRRWPFWIDLRKAKLRGGRLAILARLPDASWRALPDSPLLLERVIVGAGARRPLREWRPTPTQRRRHARMKRATLTDIIIPVYRGRQETLACIGSVLANLDQESGIVVVDDATEEADLAASLDDLAASGAITLLRNEENQGFVISVNRAMALNPTHDVVLLNSDTLVFGDWLARLRAAAYSARAVGTATPFSNTGSFAGYPHAKGAAISPEYAAALHSIATSTHPGVSVEIPVGVGFCLYIRRDCLQDVGSLDAAVFGKGYGEETDFCIRARFRGWSHRLAADTFVYHAEGVSFGRRRLALLERSNRLINLRYPGYDRFVANFLAHDPLGPVRHRLDEHRLSAFQGRFVLIVTLAMTGGVERFVAERCAELRAQGLYGLVLRPAAAGNRRRVELWADSTDLPNLRYDIPKDLEALGRLLQLLRLEAIEIQHFLHLDPRVIELVRGLPLPYDVFIHDYSWICPRVTLIDGRGRYCGEPPVSTCQKCVRRNGSQIGESISVPALRARSATWLRGARRVSAPSSDTARRLERHVSGLEVLVKPHTCVVPGIAASRDATPKVVRVALIGAIGDHKGYQMLLSCARDAVVRRLALEFVVIGYTADDAPLVATGKVFVTGRYSDAEAPHLLRREQPHIAWLASVWPETWCYALDYALAAGVPVLAFDLGAIAERIRAAGPNAGTLVPLGLKPREINDCLLQLGGITSPSQSVGGRSVQSRASHETNQANMIVVLEENIPMNRTPTGKSTQETHEEALSASIQVLPLPAGLYLFSVKAAGKPSQRLNGQLALPAVHVGLGPGVRPEDVEFVAGPNTHGAWLFTEGDLLVTKVNGAGATLVMTSVRAPGGDVLSIKVEKLESRVGSPAANAPSPGAPKRLGRAASEVGGNTAAASSSDDQILPIHVSAHVRARGDMNFDDVPWAGRVAPGLWIESFSIRPMRRLGAGDIEYKGLTGSGFETPWLTDEKMCGTKGMAVPLVGFAARLKPNAATEGYECEYSGYFQSGATVGPLRNGAPCRSTVANDPLEGIQVRLLKRAFSTTAAEPKGRLAAQAADAIKSGGRPRRQQPAAGRRLPRRP